MKNKLIAFLALSLLFTPNLKSHTLGERHEPEDLTYTKAGNWLVTRFEEFKSEPYVGIDGKSTIGFGHVIKSVNGKMEKFHIPMTLKQGYELLEKDIKSHSIQEKITVPLALREFDALNCLAFNRGVALELAAPMLWNTLNHGKYPQVVNHWLDISTVKKQRVPGLLKRRFSEVFIYLYHAIDLRTPEAPSRQGPFKHIPRVDEFWGDLNDKLKKEAVNIFRGYQYLHVHPTEEARLEAERISHLPEEYHHPAHPHPPSHSPPHSNRHSHSHASSSTESLGHSHRSNSGSSLERQIESTINKFTDSLLKDWEL